MEERKFWKSEVILAQQSIYVGFPKIYLDLTGSKICLDIVDQNKENWVLFLFF